MRRVSPGLAALTLSVLFLVVGLPELRSQATDWSSPAQRQEMQDFQQFLTSHPWIANKLRENPSLANKQDFLHGNPELPQFLKAHPFIQSSFKRDARSTMSLAQQGNWTPGNNPANNQEMQDFRQFLSAHPWIGGQLRKNPSLANNAGFLNDNRELPQFLNSHPYVQSQLRADPDGFMEVLSQASAVGIAPELPNPGRPPMSGQQQIQLGYQTAAQVYKQMPVLPDNSPETLYVRQLGAKLVATIPQQYTWPYEFHVVAQKEINAFALPGGPMFVNIGTLAAADNEAELAGVMAHEMSHVYMQHSARQMAKARTTGLFAGLAEAVAGATLGGTTGELAQQGIQFGAQSLMLKYSRTDEAQADAVGAVILWKAGYNPQALADFFKKLEQQGGGAGPQFLSDHPNPGNREAAIQKEIAGWPPKQYQAGSAAFAGVKQQAVGVKSYSAQEIAQGAKSGQWASLNEKNGAAFKVPPGVALTQPASTSAEPTAGPVSLSSVLPSSRLETANLGLLTIAHPDNWQVITPRQQGEGVTIAPQAGVTGDGIGYGVVISGVAPKQGQRLNLDQVTAALVRRFEGSGSGSKALGSPEPLHVGGVQGRSVALQSTSPFPQANGQPQQERDWLVTVPTPNGAVIGLVFVAPQAQFDQFRPTFESMLRSLQF